MKATQTNLIGRRALLLDGSGAGDVTGPRVRAAVSAALEAAGWGTRRCHTPRAADRCLRW